MQMTLPPTDLTVKSIGKAIRKIGKPSIFRQRVRKIEVAQSWQQRASQRISYKQILLVGILLMRVIQSHDPIELGAHRAGKAEFLAVAGIVRLIEYWES